MQANGAEILRLACCLATENGIRICFPLHDALLIEAPLEDLDAAVATTEQLMADASRVVLAGFALMTKTRLVRHPDCLGDARGRSVWGAIEQALAEVGQPVSSERPDHQRNTTRARANSRPIYLYGSKE